MNNRRAALLRDAGLHHSPKLWLSNSLHFSPVDHCYKNESVNSLCEMSVSWGDIWWTVGQSSSRWALIKWTISGDLGWRHKLRTEADSLNIWYNLLLLYCIIGPYVFILLMVFHLNVWDVNEDMFKLAWYNWRWLWHTHIRCVSQGIIQLPFKRDLWFWCHFVPNLSTYMCAKIILIFTGFTKLLQK